MENPEITKIKKKQGKNLRDKREKRMTAGPHLEGGQGKGKKKGE